MLWPSVYCVALQTGRAVILNGLPGEAKTEVNDQIAERFQRPLVTFIASDRDPVEIAGAFVVEDGRYRRVPPAWVDTLMGGNGIFFADELSCAPPANRAVLLRTLKEKWIGEVRLPDSTWMGAAMNPPECAEGGWDLGAPTANRMCHVQAQVNHEDWIDWMLRGGRDGLMLPRVDPVEFETQKRQASALWAAWIRHRPTALRSAPGPGAWASPRSNTYAAEAWAAAHSCGLGEAVANQIGLTLVSGWVGDIAREFYGWQEELDLPDPETVLAAPDKWDPPARTDRAFAAVGAVVALAVQRIEAAADPSKDKGAQAAWLAGWQVLRRMADAGHKDVGAASARALVGMQEKIGKATLEDTRLHECLGPYMEMLKKVGK
jgi:hypothetical protein